MPSPKPSPPQSLHFLIGGVSGAMATLIVQPIDTLKIHVQVLSQQLSPHRTWLHSLRQLHREKGLLVLYRGLGSAIWRQLYYASVRLGLYTYGVEMLAKRGSVGMGEKVAVSAVSGALGAVIGNPFDVALVRRQASVCTGVNAYKSTLDAFAHIVRHQGMWKLWRGLDITMLKVLLINIGQLAGNELITDSIRPYAPSALLPDISAILAAILTAVLSLPADNIKVKLQKQMSTQGIMKYGQYRGIGDCLKKTVMREGVGGLWVGFWMYLLRGLPHSYVVIRMQQWLRGRWMTERQ